ncbi:hypothetical protein MASR1M32_01520 [Rhodobacter sp.]
MRKFVAILCVISWSGFWAFGYLALSAESVDNGQMSVALILAALGLFTGLFTYLRLARSSDPGRWNRVKPPEGV